MYIRARTKRRIRTSIIGAASFAVVSLLSFFALQRSTIYFYSQAQQHLWTAQACQQYYPKQAVEAVCKPEIEKAIWWADHAPLVFLIRKLGLEDKV